MTFLEFLGLRLLLRKKSVTHVRYVRSTEERVSDILFDVTGKTMDGYYDYAETPHA